MITSRFFDQIIHAGASNAHSVIRFQANLPSLLEHDKSVRYFIVVGDENCSIGIKLLQNLN